MDTVIQLDNVQKIFGDHISLRGISFQVKQGDIFGYLGANGAGKTTTIRILLDLLRPSYGRATVLGRDSSDASSRLSLGFVLDADGLYNNLSARDNLDFYSRLYGLKNNYERIDQVLEKTGLKARTWDKVGTFSKGMRQRLSLARALVHDPELLILDEPMSGIDPQGRIEMREIILSLVRDDHKTVFFSSHDLDEVQRVCNRIALLNRGEILLYGDLKEVMKERSSGEVLVELESLPQPGVLEKLQKLKNLGYQEQDGQRIIFHPSSSTPVSEIVFALAGLGVPIASVRRLESSLEDIYSSILNQEGVQA